MSLSVRRLGPEDAAIFRALRLECLRAHPEAFGTAAEEEETLTPAEWLQRLDDSRSPKFAGFVEGLPMGIAGLYREVKRKHAHIANFGGMYVRPAARGTGLADALVAANLAEARRLGLALVTLTVTAGNTAAERLYARHGFAAYGRLDDTLRVDGRSYGEIMMACRL